MPKKKANARKKPSTSSPATGVSDLIKRLQKQYGGVTTALDHRSPFELLVATILSAQCTDERVNMVTPALFARYPTPLVLAAAEQAELETIIHSTGFFRNKAKNLRGMAQALANEHGGEVPKNMAALLALPGVARKTANVVLGSAFGIVSGVVVDTHVGRLAKLIGLTEHKDPKKIEQDLMQLIPKEHWIAFSHWLIHHGRAVCVARRPQCDACQLQDLCVSAFQVPPWI